MNRDDIIGYCFNDTHIEYRGEEITVGMFEWKGCWGCGFFDYENFEYYDVHESSEILDVCESTIRNWIKKGKLDGYLFIKGKPHKIYYDSSWRKYFITKESVEKLKEKGEELNEIL